MKKSYISEIVKNMPDSGIKDFFDVANTMPGALSLGVGEPDFETPLHVRQAAVASIEKAQTKYTDNLALRAVVNPGDEVLVVEPSYVSYVPCVELCQGVPVHLEMKSEDRFRLTPQKLEVAITERTRALILPFPSNPTGASMWERTVVLNGFSKAFAMTGWRMGIAAGPAEIIAAMNKIHQFTIMSAGTTSQYAALEALTSPVRDQEIDEMRREYDQRRKLLVEGFRGMGLDVVEPEGAFYVFPSIRRTGLSSVEFCRRLLNEQQVAVIPGDAFGACGEGYVRCSYAYSQEKIRECLARIGRFMEQFSP